MESLWYELGWIQAFLKDAESRQSSDARVKKWVDNVREVAFRIEDVVDTVIAEADCHAGNKAKPFNLKGVMTKPSRIRYLREGNAVPMRRPVREFVLADMDDLDVVGLQTDKDNIVRLILDPDITRRHVISIVGQGGLGKTTLAREAYNSNEVKRGFEFRLWLSVSQQFKLIDLLKMILEKIRPLKEDEIDRLQKDDLVSGQRAEEYFVGELYSSLLNKRYLIVLDDVWTEDLWIQIKGPLPDNQNGSRVLITTRSSEVAKRADPTCDAYNLRYLNEEESQQLLLRKAFPHKSPRACFPDQPDLLKRLAMKCGGLPLPLVVVGGLLSRQPPTYNSWHMVLEKLNWHVDDGKKCMDILVTSYEDMPAVIKPYVSCTLRPLHTSSILL